MNNKTNVIWFRNDLRIHDHQPLLEAIKKSDMVIPVFCIDPAWSEMTKFGTLKIGHHRFRFLLESLSDLKSNLQKLGGDLVVKIGKAEEIIPALCLQYNAQAVYAFKEVASEEVQISDRLEFRLWKYKIPLNLFLGNTLYNKEDLPFPIKDIPDIFATFRKRTERDSFVREMCDSPKEIRTPENLEHTDIPNLEQFGYNLDFEKQNLFTGGESFALKRLEEYFWEKDLLKDYKQIRNGLIGFDYSSKFSPWLSFGCISPRKVYWEVKKYEQLRIENDSTYWLIYELLWRDYFRFMFKKHGNALFKEDGIRKHKKNTIAPNEDELFELWRNAETGIPFIDANMLELKRTGFMSSRGRQNVASFLINDLQVSWRKGAAWFEENLIDYNPASNWGNWAYLAGVGNDPKEERHFNVLKQAYDFDPKGEYVKLMMPAFQNLNKIFVHQPWTMSLEEQKKNNIIIGENYPKPIVDLKYEFY